MIAVWEDGDLRVLEGNRRLTAVKLLLEPSLAPPKHQKRWVALSNALPEATREQIRSLKVRVFDSRTAAPVTAYIGYRHVAGVLAWPPLEKASYIAQLTDQGATYRDVAEKLGSRSAYMHRHHVAFQVLEQAHDEDVAGASQVGNSFGLLMRALQTDGVAKYLGISPAENTRRRQAAYPGHSYRTVPQLRSLDLRGGRRGEAPSRLSPAHQVGEDPLW